MGGGAVKSRSVIVLVAAGLVVAAYYLWTAARVSAPSLRRQIEVDLPIGTPRSRVEAWLRAHGLHYSGFVEMNGGRRVGLGGEVSDIPRFFSWSVDLQYYFYFDDEDNLKSFSVDEFDICL
jgi:hypothetical protein